MKRTLKITDKAVRRRFDTVSVPTIILSGMWLKDTGFAVGEMIEVIDQEDGSLVIRKINETRPAFADLWHKRKI